METFLKLKQSQIQTSTHLLTSLEAFSLIPVSVWLSILPKRSVDFQTPLSFLFCYCNKHQFPYWVLSSLIKITKTMSTKTFVTRLLKQDARNNFPALHWSVAWPQEPPAWHMARTWRAKFWCELETSTDLFYVTSHWILLNSTLSKT